MNEQHYDALSKIIFKRYPRIKGVHCALIAYGVIDYIEQLEAARHTPAAAPAPVAASELPKWIDSQKGRCPETDALIEYIEKLHAAAEPIVQPLGDERAKFEAWWEARPGKQFFEPMDKSFAYETWTARAVLKAPVVQAEPVHVLDAAMSLLRVARETKFDKIAPASLRRQVIESAGIAKGAAGEGEEYIYADVYGHLVEMIGPYVPGGERPDDHPFTASVTDTMELLIEHWKRTSTAPTTAAADAKYAALLEMPELSDSLLRAGCSAFRMALNEMTGRDGYVVTKTYNAMRTYWSHAAIATSYRHQRRTSTRLPKLCT